MVTFRVDVITEDNDDNYYKPTATVMHIFIFDTINNKSLKKGKWIINKQGMRKEIFVICLAKLPMKKTKSRDSTVYSTMGQTSLCGFISLKNDLY